MKTVSMKSDEDGEYPTASYGGQPTYPYGLCLHLDDDLCEKLGISKALKPGTVLTIQASAVWNYAGDLAGGSAWMLWALNDSRRTYQLTAIAAQNAAYRSAGYQ